MGYFELRIQVSRPTSAVLYWTWLLDNSFTPCALSSLECLTIFLKRIDVARTRKTFGQHTDKRHAEREMNFFSPSVSGSDGRQITREFKKKRKTTWRASFIPVHFSVLERGAAKWLEADDSIRSAAASKIFSLAPAHSKWWHKNWNSRRSSGMATGHPNFNRQ